MGRRKTILENLKRFKENLKKRIDVNRVIFFGSRASGRPHKDSDADFLCYTPEEFEKKKKQIGIVRDAVENGVEIK